GEAKFALPQEGLYPFMYKDRRKMLRKNLDVSPYVTENTFSVHLYGRRMRARLVEREGGAPHPQSFLGELLRKHGINPAEAPLPPSKAQLGIHVEKNRVKVPKPTGTPKLAPKPPEVVPRLTPEDRAGRGQVNLTDLADKHGTDKGNKRHRYTELYQMFMLPYRGRKVNVLELGLQNGGPEHEMGADRITDDLPSVRMWLEYFPKGHVWGLDICDFGWFRDDRFSFVRADMEDPKAVAAALADAPKFDFIIDDASHASHHQQLSFLTLWDNLASGGIYAFENLRWQPGHMERDGWTKSGQLFYDYQRTGAFTHSDPATQDALNGLRPDISGAFMFQVGFDKSRKDQLAVLQKR
ncbi:MAG: hypothetical protein AAF761_04915, partial [Pseudomonadota bacterium]